MNSMHKLYHFENKDDDIYINSFFRKNIFRKYEFKPKYCDKPECDTPKNKTGAHFKRVSNNSWYDTSVYNKEKDIYLLCKEMKNENNPINILRSLGKVKEIKKGVNNHENVCNFKIDKYTDIHNNILKNNPYNSLYMNRKGRNNKSMNIKDNNSIVEINASLNIENKTSTELVDKICSSTKEHKGKYEEKEDEFEDKNKNIKTEKYFLRPRDVIKSNLRLKKENLTRTSSAYCNENIEKEYFKKRCKSNIVNCKVMKGKGIQKKWVDNFNSEFDINNLDELKNKSICLNNNNIKFKNVRGLRLKDKKENYWDNLIDSSYIYNKYNKKHKYGKKEKMIFPKIENIVDIENCNLEQGEERKKNLKKNNKILTIDNSKNRKISQLFDNKFYQLNEKPKKGSSLDEIDTNNEYKNKKDNYNKLFLDIYDAQCIEIKFDEEHKKEDTKHMGKEIVDIDVTQFESERKMKEKNKEVYRLMEKIELNEIDKSVKTKNKHTSKYMDYNISINRNISDEIDKKMEESQVCINDYNFNSNDKNIQFSKGNISDNISIDFKIYKPILMNFVTQIIVEMGNRILKSVYINEYPQTFNVIIQKMNKTNNEQIINKIRNKMISIKDEDLIKFIYLNNYKEIGYSYICLKNVLKLGMDGGMFILVSNEKKESINHKHFMHSQIIPINKQEINILKPKIFMNYKIYCPKLFIDLLPINEIITFKEKIKYLEDMIRQLYVFIQNSYSMKYTKNIFNPKEIKARIIYHRSKDLDKGAENIINKKKCPSYKIGNLEVRKKNKCKKISKNYDNNQVYEKSSIQNNTYDEHIQTEKELNNITFNMTNKSNSSTHKTVLNNINVKNKENYLDIEMIKKSMNPPSDDNHKTSENFQSNSDTKKINIQKEISLDEMNESVTDNVDNFIEAKTLKCKTKKEQKNRIILSSKMPQISNENKNKIDELYNVIEKLKREVESKNSEINKLKHSNNNIKILYKSCYKKMCNHEEKKKKKKIQICRNNLFLSKFNDVYNYEIPHGDVEKNVLINPSIENTSYFDKENEEIAEVSKPNINMKEEKINYNEQKEESQPNKYDIDAVVDSNTTLNEIDVEEGNNTISNKKTKQHLDNIENKLIEFGMLLENNELIKHELNEFDVVNDESDDQDNEPTQNEFPLSDANDSKNCESKNRVSKNLDEYDDICEEPVVDNLDSEKCFTNKIKKINKYDNNIRFNFPLNFVKSCSQHSNPERS
ncbi:conserved Plasmodium protein, unknown function [Plasmodium vinckei vinckei]|uniref:Uncharacterized protein n=1 Tax=Plasmodium vinckei vinckei TaxID=54757 RepID=A0A449BVV2_PLAVN|nr:conserved Plasmodium protein, unknown function [Plasmodium vinckei vinckei]KEG02555.1 hypothetical protein YYE_02383 [Plasmodium vinckei vinckei]VEV57449.1 conserved Plasmodium protein, unknown function [Plasmodium vinckei vinckei]